MIDTSSLDFGAEANDLKQRYSLLGCFVSFVFLLCSVVEQVDTASIITYRIVSADSGCRRSDARDAWEDRCQRTRDR
jgi:hypothetical protein